MDQTLVFLHVVTVVVRAALIFVSAEKMAYCRVSVTLLHIACVNLFESSLNFTGLIPCFINFIIKLLIVLELRMLDKLLRTSRHKGLVMNSQGIFLLIVKLLLSEFIFV